MAATPMYFAGACLRGARLARARRRAAAGRRGRRFAPSGREEPLADDDGDGLA